jgi:hypothetical protein
MRIILVAAAAGAAVSCGAPQQRASAGGDGCGSTSINGLSQTDGVIGGHFSSQIYYSSSYITTPEFIVMDGSTLPGGLTLDTHTGLIEGVPTEFGTWTVDLGVRDAVNGTCPEGLAAGLWWHSTHTIKIYTSLTE